MKKYFFFCFTLSSIQNIPSANGLMKMKNFRIYSPSKQLGNQQNHRLQCLEAQDKDTENQEVLMLIQDFQLVIYDECI